MKKQTKHFKWSMIFVFIGILTVTVLGSELSAGGTFNPKKRKFSAKQDYSSEIEKQIRAGSTSTAKLIVKTRPRLWMRGNWDWEKNNVGSFAWRIVHGEPMYNDNPADDQSKYEFYYVFRQAQQGIHGGTFFSKWILMTIIAAEAVARDAEWNLPHDLPATSKNPDYDPQYPADEFFTAARKTILERSTTELKNEWPYNRCFDLSVGYDWLVNRKYSDGITPVLSKSDRETLQNNMIKQAEYVRNRVKGDEHLFKSEDIADFVYVMVGLALYEPSDQGISVANNAKAKQYLDEFDKYWIGKILPALNEQGGTGGWHAGLCNTSDNFDGMYSVNEVLTYAIAPVLYAHYTATGQSFENSIFSTGNLKYAAEFQNYMIYPDGEYFPIYKEQGGQRYRWIRPMLPTARRRFSADPAQQWLGELAGWIRNAVAPGDYVNAGSHDVLMQLLWEEKFPNARSAEQLGCGTRHFAKLGWVCMRSGFSSPDDLAGLFICQRYHWSELDPYAQNSFNLERKGKLIKGFQNTIWLDDQCQRTISGFPTITEGVAAYAPGSKYDVGPGILNFESTDDYDYMLGDATNAYDKNKLERFTRGLVWIKSKNIFVIFDRVVTKKAGIKMSWIIDPATMPKKRNSNLLQITNGAGSLWINRILPAQVSEKMSESRYEVTPNQLAKENYFLFVMQAVDAVHAAESPKLVADDASLIKTENQIGINIEGWKIWFDKSGSDGISVEFTGIKDRK